jgi:hypothetical protein
MLATGTPETLGNFADKIMPALGTDDQAIGSAAE